MVLPAPTGKVAGMAPEKPTHPKQKGTPKPDWLATSGCESSSSNDIDNEDEEYVSCFLESLGLEPDSENTLDNETNQLSHHARKIGNKAVPIFHQAVTEDLNLFTAAPTQITASVYAMHEAIV
jgi:hypothetical protein